MNKLIDSKKRKIQQDEDQEDHSLLDNWANFLEPPLGIAQRISLGKALRNECSRKSHADFARSKSRRDPVALLRSQDTDRVSHLIPLRYSRLSQSPFAFFRGAAIIMATDLSTQAHTKAYVQLSGDCHLSNFGMFATPERNIIFDLNDFDETLPGPFEWDLKRLAASFVIAAESNGFSKGTAEKCVLALINVYREKMQLFSEMSTLDIWYEKVDSTYLVEQLKKSNKSPVALNKIEKLRERRGHAGAVSKFTEVVDGKRRIKDAPPIIYHPDDTKVPMIKDALQAYLKTIWPSRQRLIQRYRFVDLAAKVVGVGSVGNAAGIILLHGEGGESDYIVLQIKEAVPSVLEKYLWKSQFDHPGERIVSGQRLLQSASDLFLGWTSGPVRDFYIRQLMDAKMSVEIEDLDEVGLQQYAKVCAYVLARAHARTGDPAVIHGYLGNSDSFTESLTKFALEYAKQNMLDFERLHDAIDNKHVYVEHEH